MPLSAVIQLEALADAQLDRFSGRGVHGFWFDRWSAADPSTAEWLHAAQEAEFSLSPLMGLPRPGRGGMLSIQAGQKAWFRCAALSNSLCEQIRSTWLEKLELGSPLEIPKERTQGERVIPGVNWELVGVALEPGQHTFASQVAFLELSRRCLMNSIPPRQWKLEFLTPTTFHGAAQHLPFPLPESLIRAWLRRWQAFAPLGLPEAELLECARNQLAVSAYRLQTLPAPRGRAPAGWLCGHARIARSGYGALPAGSHRPAGELRLLLRLGRSYHPGPGADSPVGWALKARDRKSSRLAISGAIQDQTRAIWGGRTCFGDRARRNETTPHGWG